MNDTKMDAAVIEAVADAMFPRWLTNSHDVREALTWVHQNHPVPAIRAQAWASHRFCIDWAIGEKAHESAMVERQTARRGNVG